MNLGQLLSIAGVSRDAFTALARRGALPFIDRGIEGVTAHDRYSNAHALGLATFEALRKLGLSPALAGEAVNASWADIRRAVGEGEHPFTSVRCGMRTTTAGHEWLGSPNNDGVELSSIGVDLLELWKILSPKLAATIGARENA